MTKSTITREQITAWMNDANYTLEEPLNADDAAAARAILAMGDELLAAMDSEPVAWTDEEELRDANESGCGYLFGIERDANKFADPRRQIMLYRHAQPAPVVPDEMPEHTGPREFGRPQAYVDGWNACRAAMLQAGNSPVIPDTWIPVSERMPEDEQEVLTINRMGHRFVSFFDKHSGLFFDRIDAPSACCIEHVLVTHWMELPAAPQEVVNGQD